MGELCSIFCEYFGLVQDCGNSIANTLVLDLLVLHGCVKMTGCKTAVTLSLTHWSYHALVLILTCIDGLMQKRHNYIANTLELRLLH